MIHSCGWQPLHGDLKRAVRLGIAVKYVEDEGGSTAWMEIVCAWFFWADNRLMLHGLSRVSFALFNWPIHFLNEKQ